MEDTTFEKELKVANGEIPYAANSSRSKALYLSSAGFNFLEKNEIGFH